MTTQVDHIDDMEESIHCYNQAMEHFEKRDYSRAISLFSRSVDLHPHSKTYERLYECSVALHQIDQADRYIELAYACNPRSDKAAFLYAETLIRKSDLERATAILLEIIQRNPSYKKATEKLGELSRVNHLDQQ